MQLHDVEKMAQAQGVRVSQEKLRQLADSPEAKQLLTLLNRDGGTALRSALSALSSGDQAGAKQTLEQALADPQAAALMKKLGQQHG